MIIHHGNHVHARTRMPPYFNYEKRFSLAMVPVHVAVCVTKALSPVVVTFFLPFQSSSGFGIPFRTLSPGSGESGSEGSQAADYVFVRRYVCYTPLDTRHGSSTHLNLTTLLPAYPVWRGGGMCVAGGGWVD
jgi:hypothetical protein